MVENARIDGRTRDTRDRIRRVATDLFFSAGFSATSVREITAACSVTPGALYNHYGSKEAILVDIFDQTMAEIDDVVTTVMQEADTASGKLALMALAVTNYHAAKREHGSIILNQSNWLPDKHQRARDDWFRGYRRGLERLLAEGVAAGEMVVPLDGELDGALALTAKGLFDMWTQIGAWFRPGGPVSSTDAARTYARLSLQALGAPAQDAAIDAACAKHLSALTG